MARRPLTNPRKKASQARSRATVDALIEATARILARDGFDRTNTNRIAEEAGVSVGSLYQYFPCKEALVAAVVERHHQELMAVARDTLAEIATLPIEKAIRRIMRAAIQAHRVNPRLHRVLTEQLPRTGRLVNGEPLIQQVYAPFRTYLESRRDELRVADLELAAFVCVTTVEALAHTAVLHRPEPLSDEAAESLIDEATRLLVRYLH